MSNAINFDLDNFSFKAFSASLGLSKILPALITLAICLLAIWLLTKLTDKLLGRSKRSTAPWADSSAPPCGASCGF